MTDPVRTPDPAAVARGLPRGSGVILRHYDSPEREELAHGLVKVCRQKELVLLVGGDAALARKVGAGGVHLPEGLVDLAPQIRRRHPRWIVTAAVHGREGLRRAARHRVDAALLAPVFKTASHPDRDCLGPLRFRALGAGALVPVYGLGGISVQTIRRLQGARLAGVAVIGAAMNPS